MSRLTDIITASDRRGAQPVARRRLPRRSARRAAGRVRGARPLPPRQRQPLRARARAVLPLRHPPLPHSAATRRGHAARSIPFAGYTNLLKRRFEEAIDIFLAAQAERRAERRHLQRAGRRLPRARLPDARRPGAPQRALACAATSGCSAPAIPPITRCASAPNCCARRRRAVPDPARSHARCAWT